MMTATTEPETFHFQAEVSRVMDIIINSLYSNRDIFLRELVSNASDACDKKRFLSLSGGEAAEGSGSGALAIRVQADKEARTITISDDGIGMTRDELQNNLGRIAESGTTRFLEALGEGQADVGLIGRFGVGFYSSFLVADTVIVQTKSKEDADAWQWQSLQNKNYTIAKDDASFLPEGHASGTRVTLHVKEEHAEYVDTERLKSLLHMYSEFVSFPIYLWETRTEYETVKEKDESTGEEKDKPSSREVTDWTLVNKTKPIWMRRAAEVSDDEYAEFYKSISRDYQAPMARSHFAAEGEVEFRSVLFVPRELPFELTQNMFNEQARALKLYVKRVFISDKFDELIPRWLSFIKGMVDSEDLPLNVSREILQQSRVARIIGKRVVRKSVDMFKEIAARAEKDDRGRTDYDKFWANFGRYLKVGAFEDNDWSRELQPLLRFHTSVSDGCWVSLDDYAARIKEGQGDKIYYVAAESRTAAAESPLLERLNKAGYEVVFLLEPVDELVFQSMSGKYADKYELVDVAKADVDFDGRKAAEAEAEQADAKSSSGEGEGEGKGVADAKSGAASQELEPLCKLIQDVLSEKLERVQVSKRLTDSPAAVSQSSFSVSPTMERFMRSQAASMNEDTPMGMYGQKKVLELNPAHPLVRDLNARVQSAGASVEQSVKDAALLMFETALLQAGYELENKGAFARRISAMMGAGLGVAAATTAGGGGQAGEGAQQKAEAEVVEQGADAGQAGANGVHGAGDTAPHVEAEVVEGSEHA